MVLIFWNPLRIEDSYKWALCVGQRLYKCDKKMQLCQNSNTQTFRTSFARKTLTLDLGQS